MYIYIYTHNTYVYKRRVPLLLSQACIPNGKPRVWKAQDRRELASGHRDLGLGFGLWTLGFRGDCSRVGFGF